MMVSPRTEIKKQRVNGKRGGCWDGEGTKAVGDERKEQVSFKPIMCRTESKALSCISHMTSTDA